MILCLLDMYPTVGFLDPNFKETVKIYSKSLLNALIGFIYYYSFNNFVTILKFNLYK